MTRRAAAMPAVVLAAGAVLIWFSRMLPVFRARFAGDARQWFGKRAVLLRSWAWPCDCDATCIRLGASCSERPHRWALWSGHSRRAGVATVWGRMRASCEPCGRVEAGESEWALGGRLAAHMRSSPSAGVARVA